MSEISLRDYFAASALQGLLASGHFTLRNLNGTGAWMTSHLDELDDDLTTKHIGRKVYDFPEAAYRCADAMLEYRASESGVAMSLDDCWDKAMDISRNSSLGVLEAFMNLAKENGHA